MDKISFFSLLINIIVMREVYYDFVGSDFGGPEFNDPKYRNLKKDGIVITLKMPEEKPAGRGIVLEAFKELFKKVPEIASGTVYNSHILDEIISKPMAQLTPDQQEIKMQIEAVGSAIYQRMKTEIAQEMVEKIEVATFEQALQAVEISEKMYGATPEQALQAMQIAAKRDDFTPEQVLQAIQIAAEKGCVKIEDAINAFRLVKVHSVSMDTALQAWIKVRPMLIRPMLIVV